MKHVKIISIAIVFVLIAGIIAITYAKWSVKEEQNEVNTLTTGCLETTIVEGEAISMTNAYPVTDDEGMDGKAYTFTLKNTCSEPQQAQINLEMFATTASFDASQIRFSLNGDSPAYVNSLETMNPILNNATNGYILTTDILNPDVDYQYNLKMWIAEEVTAEEGANKAFKTKISLITSYGKVSETTPVVKKYYAFGLPTTTSTTNYNDVITSSGSNAFVQLEGEQLSVCIYRNETLECFKNNNYEEELEHLKQVFGEGSCNVSGSRADCYSGVFYCGAVSDGLVGCSEDTAGHSCRVSSDGSVSCS